MNSPRANRRVRCLLLFLLAVGVRPSSGAASLDMVRAPEFAKSFVSCNAAAPADGRTPTRKRFPPLPRRGGLIRGAGAHRRLPPHEPRGDDRLRRHPSGGQRTALVG